MTQRKRPRVRETVSLYEAKTNLSSLVERAAAVELPERRDVAGHVLAHPGGGTHAGLPLSLR